MMTCVKFGKALLELDDLHPEYTLLWKANWKWRRLYRWIFAYCLYSHTGVASHLSEYKGSDFYKEGLKMQPRGTSRRYFRGKWMEAAFKEYQKNYSRPECVLEELVSYRPGTVNDVIEYAQVNLPQFGLWGGFKLADMLERLGILRLECKIKHLKMDKKPTQGAQILADKLFTSNNQNDPAPDFRLAVKHLIHKLRDWNAPPFDGNIRPFGPLEAETVFCKWVSHLKGKYEPGKEVLETHEELKMFPCNTSKQLDLILRKGKSWCILSSN